MIDIEEYAFELEDLKKIYQILYNRDVPDLDLNKTDRIVKDFGLDKCRDVYFHNSRK